MNKEDLIRELKLSKEYFDRSSRCLEEADADYCPANGVYSARQQVAHIAATVDWFCAGSAGTGERGLRVSVDAALRAGIFKASGSIDPMGWSVGARRSFPRP